jgi:hypothetical protein
MLLENKHYKWPGPPGPWLAPEPCDAGSARARSLSCSDTSLPRRLEIKLQKHINKKNFDKKGK